LLTPERALVRTGPVSGFAVALEHLAPALTLALASPDHPRPERHLLTLFDHGAGENAWPEVSKLMPSAPAGESSSPEESLRVEGRPSREDPLLRLASGFDPLGLDLLQGPYAVHSRWRHAWVPLRGSAALLLLWLGLHALLGWQEGRELEARHRELEARIEATFRRTFPEVRRVVDARAQMTHRLEQLRQSSGGNKPAAGGFLELLEASGESLRQETGLRLDSLKFHKGERDKGELEMGIHAPEMAALDRLLVRLGAIPGLKATLQSADKADDGIAGRLRIQG
ncbi:MAG: hypothetical protein HQL59_12100, partial [Magnetococcales bacterium]|nr:hypothetical protein [Magnetococcales bacterium]